jgi:hypothetical protein
MIIAMIEYNLTYYHNLIQKLNRVKEKAPIHVDVFAREGTIYIMGLDDGFSATFVYMAYLKAKERGLQVSLMYARFIDESWLPEEVKKLGKKWLYQGLGVKEIEELKKVTITEYVFDKW